MSAFATAPLFHQHCNTRDLKTNKKRKKKKKKKEEEEEEEKKKETDWTPHGNSNG